MGLDKKKMRGRNEITTPEGMKGTEKQQDGCEKEAVMKMLERTD